LDVFVPPEEIVVLTFLLVGHLEDVVVKLSEHVKIGESDVVAHEKGSTLQMLLKVLNRLIATFLRSLPSFSWVLI
jgi:hypothetical protein